MARRRTKVARGIYRDQYGLAAVVYVGAHHTEKRLYIRSIAIESCSTRNATTRRVAWRRVYSRRAAFRSRLICATITSTTRTDWSTGKWRESAFDTCSISRIRSWYQRTNWPEWLSAS